MAWSAYEALYKVLMNINESSCQPYGMASALIVIGVSAWYPDSGVSSLSWKILQFPTKFQLTGTPTIMLSPMNDVWNKCVPEHYKESCYRPQTKFVKVMFLQVPVCPQGGLCLEGSLSRWVVPVQGVSVQGDLCRGGGGLCPGGFCPGGLCPEGSLSRGSLFPRGVSVQDGEFLSRGGLCPGGVVSVRVVRAGGTHPTGMHSCSYKNFVLGEKSLTVVVLLPFVRTWQLWLRWLICCDIFLLQKERHMPTVNYIKPIRVFH